MHVMLEYMDFSYMTIQSKKIFSFHTLSTAGFNTASTFALLAEDTGSKKKNPVIQTCKTSNCDGSRYVLMPKGLHHAETA